jgi:hypothetical protein
MKCLGHTSSDKEGDPWHIPEEPPRLAAPALGSVTPDVLKTLAYLDRIKAKPVLERPRRPFRDVLAEVKRERAGGAT